MAEQFTNNAATTLSVAITTPARSVCTVADASALPASSTFRIKIDEEILVVTGVVGSTFTVTRGAEGTTAATHASGASVIHLLTKGGLEARVANRFVSDIYDNKPAAGVKGRLFLPTDGLFLEYDDGSAWHKYGPYKRLISPPQTGWEWINQGKATATFSDGVLVIEDPDLDGSSAWNMRLFVRPIQQLPATVTMAFLYNGGTYSVVDAEPYMGFCARSSSGTMDGQFTTLGIGPISNGQVWQKADYFFSSPTATETGGLGEESIGGCPPRLHWRRMTLDGNEKSVYISADGVNWVKLWTYSLATGSTPNQFGIFIDPRLSPYRVSMTLVHWEES